MSSGSLSSSCSRSPTARLPPRRHVLLASRKRRGIPRNASSTSAVNRSRVRMRGAPRPAPSPLRWQALYPCGRRRCRTHANSGGYLAEATRRRGRWRLFLRISYCEDCGCGLFCLPRRPPRIARLKPNRPSCRSRTMLSVLVIGMADGLSARVPARWLLAAVR